jgi:hypothetical protein
VYKGGIDRHLGVAALSDTRKNLFNVGHASFSSRRAPLSFTYRNQWSNATEIEQKGEGWVVTLGKLRQVGNNEFGVDEFGKLFVFWDDEYNCLNVEEII